MLTLSHRLGTAIVVLMLFAGFVAMSQLGSTASAQTPPPTAAGDTLVAGERHSCALMVSGEVQCWGGNEFGQLGSGTTVDSVTPAAVVGLAGPATALAASGHHTCALLVGGQVQCWGGNEYGQLGNGTTTSSTSPVTVTGFSADATAIAAGNYHTCAVTTDGQIECWGSNSIGQLGNGTAADALTPSPVSDLAGPAIAVTSGGLHTCAVVTDGQIQCWGHNSYGQLGNGTTTGGRTPTTVAGLAGPATAFTALTTGGYHTCAVITDGQIQCWGYNFHGQLGNGTTTDSRTPTPVTVQPADAATLAAGGYHTCAVTTDGQVRCWGLNHYGQLGNGTTTNTPTPVTVTGLAGSATALSSNDFSSCALLADGRVQCWGNNLHGQLGDGTTTNRHNPVSVAGLSGPVRQPVRPIAEATQTQLTLDRVTMTAGGTLTATAVVTPARAAGTVVFTVAGQQQRIAVTAQGQAAATFQLDAAGDHTVVATFEPANPARHSTSSDHAAITVGAAPVDPPVDPPVGGLAALLASLLAALGS